MRTLLLSTAIGAALMSAALANPSRPQEGPRFAIMAIGKVTNDNRDALQTAFNKAFLGLKPGDGIVVYDAVNRAVVTKIDVPNEPRFKLAGSILKSFGGRYNNVRQFLTKDGSSGVVLVPDLLDEVAKHLKSDANGRRIDMLLLAEALHFDPREPGFSMRGAGSHGIFPSDGYIAEDERRSPFGAANRRGLLANMDLYWCHTDPREHWGSSLHTERVERAWSLYAAELGATVATFTHDVNRCVNSFQDGKSNLPRQFTIDRTAKPQMLRTPMRVSDLGSAGTVTTRDTAAEGDNFLKPGVQLSRRPPPAAECQVSKIGIRWSMNVDIDLWARNDRSNSFLSFQSITSPEGRYNHDWQASPDQAGAMEYIDFVKPLNLRRTEVWLNFFDGTASPGPSGEIRVFCDGKVFQGQFKFEPTQGNKAAGFTPEGTMRGQHWLRVDLAKLVGLPTQNAAR
jgi:hypothetical protein